MAAKNSNKLKLLKLKTYTSTRKNTFIMPPVRQKSVNFSIFSVYIYSADITPEMLELCRVTLSSVGLL